MPWAAAAVVGGALISSEASKSASKTQANAAGKATDAQERMFDKQVALQQPWLDQGQAGLNQLGMLLGTSKNPDFANPAANSEVQRLATENARNRAMQQVASGWGADFASNPAAMAEVERLTGTPSAEDTASAYQQVNAGWGNPAANSQYGSLVKPFSMQDFQSDPGYQFRQSEGEKGLQRAASAQGGIGSGRFLKDAMRFNQGLASQDYGAAFDRFNVGQTNQFNRLASMSGIGQTAANQTGAAASNYGSQIGSNIMGAGNAMAAGQVGSANAFNNAAGQGASMYQQNQLMNRFFPQSSTSGYGAWNSSPMSSTIYSNGSLGD